MRVYGIAVVLECDVARLRHHDFAVLRVTCLPPCGIPFVWQSRHDEMLHYRIAVLPQFGGGLEALRVRRVGESGADSSSGREPPSRVEVLTFNVLDIG
jgi:hypothetical protein